MREPSIGNNEIGNAFGVDEQNYLSVFNKKEFDDPMKKKYQLIQKENSNNKSQSSLKQFLLVASQWIEELNKKLGQAEANKKKSEGKLNKDMS